MTTVLLHDLGDPSAGAVWRSVAPVDRHDDGPAKAAARVETPAALPGGDVVPCLGRIRPPRAERSGRRGPRRRPPDTAAASQPHQYATGINYVIVNGTVVLEEGKHTGARPGTILYGRGKAQ